MSLAIKTEDVTGSRRDVESAGAAMGDSGANGLIKTGPKQTTGPASNADLFPQNFSSWTESILFFLDDSRQLLRDSFSKKEDKFSFFLHVTSYLLNGIL